MQSTGGPEHLVVDDVTITGGGAKAVGNAVNETVVYAFMALFVINVVVTAIGIRMTAS